MKFIKKKKEELLHLTDRQVTNLCLTVLLMLEMDRQPNGDCRDCQTLGLIHTVLKQSVAANWDCCCSAPTSSIEICFWPVSETELRVSLSFSFIQFLQHQLMYKLIRYRKIHIIVITSDLKCGCSTSLNLHVFHSF